MGFIIGLAFTAVLIVLDVSPTVAVAIGLAVGLIAYRGDQLDQRIRGLERSEEARRMPMPRPAAPQPAAPWAPPAQPAAPQPAGPWVPPAQPAAPQPAAPWVPPAQVASPTHATPSGWSRHAQTRPSRHARSLTDLEELFAGRLLAAVGGIALAIGVVFFLGLAFSRGWIGPEARVVMGLVAGSVAFVAGASLFGGRQRVVGHVLLAVGLAAVSLSLYAATRLYGLIGAELALAGSLAAALAAAAVALRRGSQLVAGYGLVAVLAAPQLMGAPADLVTIAFLATALVGTTTLSVVRDWRWLPPVAFLLVAPQLASYLLDSPPFGIALGALSGFWLLNVLAASGEELRRRNAEPSPTSATVFLAAAAFLVWGGFIVLDGSLEPWRGLFLVVVALAHLALGAAFVVREHDRHAFALLVLGTGVAALTMAVPIQLGGPPVPIAWAAEAAALAWVASRRGHLYSAAVASLLGALAIGHLVAIEYPLVDSFDQPWLHLPQAQLPFASGRGGALGFVLVALAASAWFARVRAIRAILATVGIGLVTYAIGFELRPLAQLTAWAGLAAGTALVMRRWLRIPLVAEPAASELASADRAPYLVAALAGLAAVGVLVSYLLPLDALPFRLDPSAAADLRLDSGTAGALILAAGALVAGFGPGVRTWRVVGVIGAASIVAYALPFDLPPAWAVVGWAALGAVLLAAHALEASVAYRPAAGAFALAGIALVLGTVMTPGRLLVDGVATARLPFLNAETMAGAAVIGLLVAIFDQSRSEIGSRWAIGVASIVGVYLASVGVVDLFQAQVGAGLSLEELQKQAQVALSVLWALMGGGALAIGLAQRQLAVRAFGLAMLALATSKVFLFDLATLDVAYRVLAFIGLGLLLLASAWIVFRLQPWASRTDPSSQ